MAGDGNLWDVVIVKSWVNKQAGFWLAAQVWWTTKQKLGQQADPTLDMTTTRKFPLQEKIGDYLSSSRDHKAMGRRPFDKMATLLAYLGPPEHRAVDTQFLFSNFTR